MSSTNYLALLRGINVGGSNIIKMADLKECFEKIGFSNVATYIQSGNVIFQSHEKDVDKLVNKLEESLSSRFGYKSRVVVITLNQLKQVVEKAPDGFGKESDKYRYDVIFLKNPLRENEAMNSLSIKEGVDAAYKGKGVLYFSRLISKATQSRLARIVSHPSYQHMTIRNWNTTTKLLALMTKA